MVLYMRIAVLLLVLFSIKTHAGIKDKFDDGLAITSVPFAFTGIISVISLYYISHGEGPDLIRYAQPDAASYVASDGKINSAYLQETLIILRKKYPNASDMQLAKAIVAY